ncbi:ABC transporter substrate-binding protein [Natrinema marinum]|uniref:ABC transporter substrate-binding protein n=1 Tax=Natrinema marinum TaxID=2961598 RepID=UPI0020C88226|nr:ABC transporter substrate-binding protein [Natrinema marinum]
MDECGGAEHDPSLATDQRTRRSGLQRRRVLATAGSAVSLSTAGCLGTLGSITGGSGSENPITMGILAPNPDSNYIGRGMVRGAQVAVDEINEKGGILGRHVELAVGDTNSSPLEARRQYQRLVLEEDADVTVGVFDSPSLETIIEDIAEQQTVHLTSGASTPAVSQKVSENYDRYKYHFRVGPTNSYDLGTDLVNFLDDNGSNIGWNSVAVLVEDYPWSQEPWQILQDELDGVGVEVTMERRYPPASDDFSSLYDEAEASNADAAFILTAHTGTSALLDWAYPNRPEVPPQPRPFAFGGIHVPMQLPAYYEMTGGLCRYGVAQISATANSDAGPLTQQFVGRYRDTYGGTPVYTGYTTYEAVMLYRHVIEQTKTQDTETVIGALENVNFDGATGQISFYDKDHQYAHDLEPSDDGAIYMQWQENDEGEGVQEVIWPKNHQTAEYQTPYWL